MTPNDVPPPLGDVVVDPGDLDSRVFYVRAIDFGEASGLDKNDGDVLTGVVLAVTPYKPDHGVLPPLQFIMRPGDLADMANMAVDFLCAKFPDRFNADE